MDSIMVENRAFKSCSRVKPLSSIKYQSLFWLFMTGSILGFVLEGLWRVINTGHWEHHAATIWGPFCIIYGIGAVAAFLISQLLSDTHILLQFGAFFFSGAFVEYLSSLFQEICFGSVSWDYSNHILNIGGRISLQMALIWGILGVFFMRFLFPALKKLLEKLNRKNGSLICVVLTVFMVINLAATSVAISRWHTRKEGTAPQNSLERVIDYIYGNEKMERLFPNMRFTINE